jgi:ubiquinone/menaquinone biosynthesis C-methylase UbiE
MSLPIDFIEGKVLSGRVYPEFFPFQADDVVLNVGCGYGVQAIAYDATYQKMVGVDIVLERVQKSLSLYELYPLETYTPVCADVEQLPLPTAQFDKAIAIDIIEHVQNPQALCREINRVLIPGGQVLITFPTLHDTYTAAISWFARTILRRKSKGTFHDTPSEWHPDAHNQEFPVDEWIALVESCGLHLVDSRATTLFPPLHLYGVPRFWFSVDAIHAADSALSRLPGLKNYGQGLMAIFQKVPTA